MTYISQEQAVKLADQAEADAEKQLQCTGEYHPDYWKVEAHLLCNAAIAHFLQQMGEGLPEPVIAREEGAVSSDAYYTREQMIAFGAAQREKALDALVRISAICNNDSFEVQTYRTREDEILTIANEAIRDLKGKQ